MFSDFYNENVGVNHFYSLAVEAGFNGDAGWVLAIINIVPGWVTAIVDSEEDWQMLHLVATVGKEMAPSLYSDPVCRDRCPWQRYLICLFSEVGGFGAKLIEESNKQVTISLQWHSAFMATLCRENRKSNNHGTTFSMRGLLADSHETTSQNNTLTKTDRTKPRGNATKIPSWIDQL